MPYSRPYIMDLPGMNDKLEGTHAAYPSPEALPTPILKEIIRELVRLEAHCDCARQLCEENIDKIIRGTGTPVPYPPLPTNCP